MFRKILVPTDFSPPSAAALEYARALAATYGSSLRILHVIDDPSAASEFVGDGFAPSTHDIREGVLAQARQRLAHVLSAAECTRFHVQSDAVIGLPAQSIVDYAAAINADLIVMGTHGRTGLAHLLMGSVAEHVVRASTCPVLTVHPHAEVAEALEAHVLERMPVAVAI